MLRWCKEELILQQTWHRSLCYPGAGFSMAVSAAPQHARGQPGPWDGIALETWRHLGTDAIRATSSHTLFQEQQSHEAVGTEVEQQVSPEKQTADAENRRDWRWGRREAKAVTHREHEDAEQEDTAHCLVSAIENRHFMLLTSQSMLSLRACCAAQSAKYSCPKKVHVRSWRTKLDVAMSLSFQCSLYSARLVYQAMGNSLPHLQWIQCCQKEIDPHGPCKETQANLSGLGLVIRNSSTRFSCLVNCLACLTFFCVWFPDLLLRPPAQPGKLEQLQAAGERHSSILFSFVAFL